MGRQKSGRWTNERSASVAAAWWEAAFEAAVGGTVLALVPARWIGRFEDRSLNAFLIILETFAGVAFVVACMCVVVSTRWLSRFDR